MKHGSYGEDKSASAAYKFAPAVYWTWCFKTEFIKVTIMSFSEPD
jgi:hypothetical protein